VVVVVVEIDAKPSAAEIASVVVAAGVESGMEVVDETVESAQDGFDRVGASSESALDDLGLVVTECLRYSSKTLELVVTALWELWAATEAVEAVEVVFVGCLQKYTSRTMVGDCLHHVSHPPPIDLNEDITR